MSRSHKLLRNKERTQKNRDQLEACNDLSLSHLSTRNNEMLHSVPSTNNKLLPIQINKLKNADQLKGAGQLEVLSKNSFVFREKIKLSTSSY
jgi:hypothetical protein